MRHPEHRTEVVVSHVPEILVPVQTISPSDASTICLQIVDHEITTANTAHRLRRRDKSSGLLLGLKSPALARQKSGCRVSTKQGRHSRQAPHTILCHGAQSLRDTFHFEKKVGLDRRPIFPNLNTELFQVPGSVQFSKKRLGKALYEKLPTLCRLILPQFVFLFLQKLRQAPDPYFGASL